MAGTDEVLVRFADAARRTQLDHRKPVQALQTKLPPLEGSEMPSLCMAVRLKNGDVVWKCALVVAEIVQATARIATERVHLVPVPDARQFGNTQKVSCSWIV